MRKVILFTIAILLISFGLLSAQTIPPTGFKQPCAGCTPAGWTMGSGSVDISDNIHLAGNQSLSWSAAVSTPPSWSGEPYASFLTSLNNSIGLEESAFTTVSGLTIGQRYKLTYHVISLKQGNGSWGTTAKINASNGAAGYQPTDFLIPGNAGTGYPVNTWVKRVFEFIPTATSARITFSGEGANPGGYVGLDIKAADLQACNTGTAQVVLDKTSLTNVCPATSVNLNEAYTGSPHAGSKLVWFKNANHTGWSVLDPTKVTESGDYYAFLYDQVNDCYNTDNSNAKITVTVKPVVASYGQVSLNTTSSANLCPGTTADLNKSFNSGTLPPGAAIVWYNNPTHANSPVLNPSKVGNGTYYAFFVDPVENCYNTDISTSKVTVFISDCCLAGNTQVAVNPTLSNVCPSTTVNLNQAYSGSVPQGTSLYWYQTPDHTGPAIQGTGIAASGTYYAFFYDAVNNCYNTNNSTAKVTVTITKCCKTGVQQVPLSASTLQNVCPSTTANLSSVWNGVLPSGSAIIWYTNPNHTGNPVPDPAVVEDGTYYAFFVDVAEDCYNTNNSTSKVTVKINRCQPCNAPSTQVPLSSFSQECLMYPVNLNAVVLYGIPPGTSVVWFTNPSHTGLKLPNSIADSPGTYYAFYYDKTNNCYNTNNSTAIVTLDPPAPPVQVKLSTDFICGQSTVNLNSLVVGSPPAGTQLVWFTDDSHSGSSIVDPTHLNVDIFNSGTTYYAFYGYGPFPFCYKVPISTAKVKLEMWCQCNAGTDQVLLSQSQLFLKCATETVDLKDAFNGLQIPASLVWFNNASHSGSPIANPAAVSIGTYYAFIYDAANNCYNTDNSTAVVNVLPAAQVSLNTTEGFTCAPATFNLFQTVPGAAPAGASLRWFTNPNHTGAYIADPTQVSYGTYYAFFFYELGACQYNTDNSTAKIEVKSNCVASCNAGTGQVQLTKNQIVIFCEGKTINLNDFVSGMLPPGVVVKWYKTEQHIAINEINSVFLATGDAIYSAYYYDTVNDCYNTDLSTTNLMVIVTPSVALNCSEETCAISVSCPLTVNLNSFLSNPSPYELPNGVSVVWFNNNSHSGQPVASPTAVANSGTYYAFYYDQNSNCYNKVISQKYVNVTVAPCATCNAGTEQVTINSGTSLYLNTCKTTADLGTIFINSVPAGTEVVWYTNANHTGSPVANVSAVGVGNYYAFYFDAVNQCFNTDNSDRVVTVAYSQVGLLTNQMANTCPSETVDLQDAVDTFEDEIVPVWFTNNAHTGAPVADPAHAGAGTYYAFMQLQPGCFNVDISTSKVTVTVTSCSNAVQLAVKVALQGAMPAAGPTMRNDLQNYFGEFLGLLPNIDPYGNGAVYANIGNPTGAAGSIVDWIQVEIRSAANPSAILQTKSLLLKTDGSVVDVNGAVPSFTPQVGNVQVVVKHRNHLAIMSNPMAFAAGSVGYDFTTGLNKAFNDGSVPDQMIQVNGTWTMIVGDSFSDQGVDNTDVSVLRNAFNKGDFDIYTSRDLNMDGGVDNTDVAIQRNRFNAGYFSILTNY